MLVFGTVAHAQTVTLDTAIKNAVNEFSNSLFRGSKVAVVAIRSDSAKMSTHIIEELTSVLANQRIVTIIDSGQIVQLQREMNFQISGEISDASAQAIGKRVGAQTVITGLFEQVGNDYRLRLRVIEVETTVTTHSVNVRNDAVVASLMGKDPTPAASTPVASAPASTPAAAPAEAPVATASQEGAYEDFTGGARFGTWALNAFVIPGLGSYAVMKDKTGGGIQLALWGISDIFLLIGGGCLYGALVLGTGDSEATHEEKMSIGTTCTVIGGLLWAANGIYNIVRSATYHKPRPEIAALIDPKAWNIALLPGKSGNLERVQVSYTVRY